ncbi:MAG: DNA primase [Deltaproteobacteria bacterium]|uniref:DNA primase n=1 Tax=Candidatus Zymogenus saltonus TaxID=2844893 RepID=A0A9D8PSL5_9DELT|nr:DNA primase [Candidatus Zymogenus saltonus]
MAGKIPESTISEVIERADILELVEKYVPLKKKGKNFMGLCPFHSEKTASFSVNPEKGLFKCFGCGKGGTALTFLMEMEGMTFPEAVRELGSRYGVMVETVAPTQMDKKKDDKREKLYAVNREAEKYFIETLKGDAGKNAIKYFKEREIDGRTARDFSLGFAAKRWEGLTEHLKEKGITEKEIEEAGLAIMGDKGPYDRFRGRIIFPIKDHRGRLSGFGGRTIEDDEPKYLNSPETMVYHKGEILYGLNITKNEVRRVRHAIIVEGYLDAISLYQAGIKNVAATLGTALTPEHLNILKRYANEAVLIFDADEAGGKAAERTLPIFGEGKMYARAAVLPEGEDPDSFIRKRGSAEFLKVIEDSKDIFDFCLDRIYRRHDLNTAKGITEALDEAAYVASIKKLPQEIDFYVRKIAERLKVGEESVRLSISKKIKRETRYAAVQSRREEETPAEKPGPKKAFKPPEVESRLFKMAVNYPNLLREAGLKEKYLALFIDETLRGLIDKILKMESPENGINVASLISGVGDDGIRQKLIDLSVVEDNEIDDEDMALAIITDCIKSLDIKGSKIKYEDMKRRAMEIDEDETRQEVLKEIINIKKNMKR